MKIFAISDIHGEDGYIDYAADLISSADLVVISGDISRSGKIDSVIKIISGIEKYNKKIVAVHGNWDRIEVSDLLNEKGYGIHAAAMVIDGIGFFGVGGSSPTPMNTPSEFNEEEIFEFLKTGYATIKNEQKIVLVSHTPPHHTRDRTFLGLRGGSVTIRDFINENRVDLCICGHIHEAAGTSNLGRCVVANPGPFKKGKYCVIEIGETITVTHGKIKRPFFR